MNDDNRTTTTERQQPNDDNKFDSPNEFLCCFVSFCVVLVVVVLACVCRFALACVCRFALACASCFALACACCFALARVFCVAPGFRSFRSCAQIILLSRARNLALSRSCSRSGFQLLCALFCEFVVDLSSNGIRAQRSRKKTKSVQTDQSVISNRLRIVNFNDAK